MTCSGKALIMAFRQFIVQIYKDAMLILLMLAPILCGLFFRFGIPYGQSLIEKYLSIKEIFVPYYLLFDLFLGCMTPLLYCFAAAYVILGEIDDGISGYLSVTPLGKKGYLISRLGFPAVMSFFISILMLSVFRLSDITFLNMIGIALIAALLGILEALLVVSVSGNRVEGMAVSKLSGLFFLGLPVPFFVKGGVKYLLFFLPSLWTAEYAIEQELLYLIIGIAVSLLWIVLLYRRFERKIKR